jgi:hypothetical protein
MRLFDRPPAPGLALQVLAVVALASLLVQRLL